MNDKNQEGYMDLTASHAVRNVTKQEERNEVAARKLTGTIRYIAGLAGFEVAEITLTHGKSGRIYRL
ncbi:MAG: hypothetical protein ACLS9Q_09590 [[Clostridium] scindens]|uniref:hypothetical protein n=1 Tax=Clostridium scindens (strain JCM 10418 / VPI 12708) TaxID=29347 RepID=UPI003994BDF0